MKSKCRRVIIKSPLVQSTNHSETNTSAQHQFKWKFLRKEKSVSKFSVVLPKWWKKKYTPRDLGENEKRRNDDHAQCTTQIKPNFVLLQRVTRMRISSVCVHANGAQIIIEKEENEIKKKNFNNNNNWRCKNSLSFESV